jgi:PKD repeat protein
MKHFLLFLIFFLAGIISALSLQAQDGVNYGCATDEHTHHMMQQNPELIEQRETFDKNLRQWIDNAPIEYRDSHEVRVIPVVVHVIHEYGPENISRAQIENAISIVNADLNRRNADTSKTRAVFKDRAADMNVELRLAKIDPNGNCTEGIVRVASPLTNSAIPSDTVKSLSYWPSDRYFNIWVVKSIGGNAAGGLPIGGYAQFPGTGSWRTYGVVLVHNGMGATGTSRPNNSRLLTHEVGHCLNLYHTFETFFGNDCDANSNCQTEGDKVCDTPPMTLSQGCDRTLNSCTSDSLDLPDQIENFMGYNSDTCQNMFTLGQKARTDPIFAPAPQGFSQLRNLISTENLMATGTNTGYVARQCAPIADFRTTSIYRENICQGAIVYFTDQSYNATPDASWRYNWSFPGGTPETSNLQNPAIQYNTPGVYSVTLTVSNASGSSSVTKDSLIHVRSLIATIKAPYTENFSDTLFPGNTDPGQRWEIVSRTAATTWHRTTDAAFTPPASLAIRNQDLRPGTINEIITPAIDFSQVTMPAKVYMRIAYARTNANSADVLRIFTSRDCGRTWTPRFTRTAAQLNTADNGFVSANTTFIPTAEQWKLDSITLNANQFSGATNVLFKFQMESRGGNVLYIDDIMFGENPLSAAGPTTLQKQFEVYPNPFGEELMVDYSLPQADKVTIEIVDITGRTTTVMNNRAHQPGKFKLELSEQLSHLTGGMYYIRFISGSYSTTRKIIHTK